MKTKILIFLVTLFSSFWIHAVDHSVVATVEYFENGANLSVKKYPQCQYQMIAKALDCKQNKIRVVSYNMLFNLYDQNLKEHNRWPQRLPRIVNLLENMQPDVMGTQELYPSQLNDLMSTMSKHYGFFGRSCVDGEINGIFYRKDRFDVIDSHIWYMTKTPEVPSKETLTMVTLRDRQTGGCFSVFNTHLAFSNIHKREFQAYFIANVLKNISTPMVFMGDLNTFPHRLDMPKLPFYDGDYIHSILTTAPIFDAKDRSLLGHVGPISTFTNVNGNAEAFQGTGTPGVFLDRIYTSKDICVLIHAVESGTVNGHFPSDHMPVMVDMIVH